MLLQWKQFKSLRSRLREGIIHFFVDQLYLFDHWEAVCIVRHARKFATAGSQVVDVSLFSVFLRVLAERVSLKVDDKVLKLVLG